MTMIGIPQDKIEERTKKHIKRSATAELMKLSEQKKNQLAEINEFTQKTQDFIGFIFHEYALKELIVPGTEHASIYQDIRNIESLNAYVNKLSEFMTTKTVYLANEKQRILNEDDTLYKNKERMKKYTRGFDSDRSDANIEGDLAYAEFEEDNPQHQLESFQNVLELKLIEMVGDQNHDEVNFYQGLLQKLNAIDLLQLFLKQCARKIKSGEKLLTFKKELSFGMLQIFREQVSKKELNRRLGRADSVDFDMIDKTVRRLRFFKNFA